MQFKTPEGEAFDLVEVPNIGEAMIIKRESGYNLKDIVSDDPFVMYAFVLISIKRKHPEWNDEVCAELAKKVDLDQIVAEEAGEDETPFADASAQK